MNYVYFPRWAEVLNSSPIKPSLKQNYHFHLRQYLRWCGDRRVRVTHDSARNFVDGLQKTNSMSPKAEEACRESIRWFFRNGEKRALIHRRNREEFASESELPTDVADLNFDWERTMITVLRRKGLAIRTEKTYLAWCRRFAEHMNISNPLQASEDHINQYLDMLATEAKVTAATQKQALNALVFLLRDVAGRAELDIGGFCKAKTRKRIPVVLSRDELKELFASLVCHASS